MLNRKSVRDWFHQALSPHASALGTVYPVRVVEFDEDSEPPKAFTNVYVSEGSIRESDDGAGALTFMTLELGFNLRTGKDDDLDHCEFIADRAIEAFRKVKPPQFDFYKVNNLQNLK